MAHTILLADDSVTIRKVVELAFADTDIRVESVGSGREALERFETSRPDLVLADVLMPPPTGYELCRSIKASRRPVPVLLLRGAFEPFDEALARECGADGHVSKPFESDSLVTRVAALIAARPAPPVVMPVPIETEESLGPPDGEPERALDEIDHAVVVATDAPTQPDIAPAATVRRDTVPAPVTPAPTEIPGPSEDVVDRVARAVIAKLSDEVVREIAWEVVPDLAEALIKQRIRELERDDPGAD